MGQTPAGAPTAGRAVSAAALAPSHDVTPRLLPLALLLTGATLCGCSAGTSSETAPSAAASAPAAASTPAASTPAASPSATMQEISLTVSDGTVTGDTGRVKVPLGTSVRVTVTSDVADEVHSHLDDGSIELTAGKPGSLVVKADKPGIYEIELERSRLPLTRLQVS